MDILEIRRRARQRAEQKDPHQDDVGGDVGTSGVQSQVDQVPAPASIVVVEPLDRPPSSTAPPSQAGPVAASPPPPEPLVDEARAAAARQTSTPPAPEEDAKQPLEDKERAPVDDDGMAELLDEFFASRNDAAINRFADPAFYKAASTRGPNASDRQRFLACRVGDEEYGLDLDDTREILKPILPTPVPRAPQQVLGIIAVRGLVMPVVGLGEALGVRPVDVSQEQSRPRYVVVEHQGDRVCLRVDAVSSVVTLSSRDIEPAPRHGQDIDSEFVSGLGRIDERMIILLDLERVLEKLVRAEVA